MTSNFFLRNTVFAVGIALALAPKFVLAESAGTGAVHGISMYGTPALAADFNALPYANADAPKGGKVVFGNTGGFDTLNPFAQKGSAPWQMRFLMAESLMGRSQDEPFSLYGLLAETIEVPEDRSWVEFTLRAEARFSDGSPVTVEDVIWSFETLGTEGHARYRNFWQNGIEKIEQTGDRSVRLTFAVDNREYALIAGLRPILKKSQWDGKVFADSGLSEAPITSAAYVISDFEPGRFVKLKRNPDYWGNDLPFRRGTQNFDEMRIDLYGDINVMFEGFKAGALSTYREFNANTWETGYDFPRYLDGEVVKSEIPHGRPSGMTGFALNTRRETLSDWRVREALLLAFNFEFINETITGGRQDRISSYFSNSELGMQAGAADGLVAELLTPFRSHLVPGVIEGYELPVSDGTERNRKNLRKATKLLTDAGWSVQDGVLQNNKGDTFELKVLLRQGDNEMQSVMDIYAQALDRLGISLIQEVVDNAQYVERESLYDFDMVYMRRDLSLSPGNEQRLYWGSQAADQTGGRNLMGIQSKAADAMIETMLNARSTEEFNAATRALDRILTAGRYVLPIWQYDVARIAHDKDLTYPDYLPLYGDRATYFMPHVWWSKTAE